MSHKPNPDSQYWIARQAKPLIFIIIILALVGGFLALTIPIAVFPSTNFPRVVIGVASGVTPINQMRVTVTRPIELAVNSVRGLTKVRSITSRGQAEIDLFFSWKQDMFRTLQRVNSAIAAVRPQLPADARITVNRLEFSSFPIMGYSVTSHSMPQTRLWTLATYDLQPQLNRLNGVSKVIVQGGQQPEFAVTPNPARLVATGVTVPEILAAIQRSNLIASPGLLARQHQLFLGLVSGQARTRAQIAAIVVKTTPQGVPVRLGDIARVIRSVRPVYTIVTGNGQPAVLLNVYRQPRSNTLRVANEVHAKLAAIERTLPPGVHIHRFYDQSIIVQESIKSVRDAILIGLLLASIILVLFLRDWGTSLVAGLVIPVTLLVTFIMLKVLGQSFNLMTLGGLAAAVGLVIDDAIVVVENIVLHRDAGESRLGAIRAALSEITVALLGSTITPIVVFLPLISITGVTGTFFRALAVTMAASLLTSLALALSWTPTLSQYFIRERHGVPVKDEEAGGRTPAVREGTEMARLLAAEEASLGKVFGGIVAWYERVLRRVQQKPRWLAAGCLLLVLGSYFCYKALGSDMLPAMDEGAFVLDYLMPAGSSLSATNRVVHQVEKILLSVPEVKGISRRTGLQLGLAAVTESNTGDISVMLRQHRSRSIYSIIDELRRKVKKAEPALDIDFTQSLQDNIGDLESAPQPIRLNLFSPDEARLEKWAPRVADRLAKIPGVVDIFNGVDDTISGPAVMFQVRAAAAARAGFSPAEVATDAQALLHGVKASTPVVIGDREYAIRVRFPRRDRQSLAALRDTVLVSSTGGRATLGSLARVRQLPPQIEIRDENLQRDITVTAHLQGLDLGTAIRRVKRAVRGLHIPPSIRIHYGGIYAQQQKSFHSLLLVLGLAIVLVFAVLLFEFRNFAAPLAILASALLSTAGVFFALLVTRITFNIASFMGLIMVIGIVAKNGILLLDAEQKFRALGYAPAEAMLQAGRRRLRPITMTALAAVAGMLPLALGWGSGSQMLQPLAVSVIGGIVISMALSLIVTPLVNYYLTREGREKTAPAAAISTR